MSSTRVHPLSWLLSNNRLEKVPFVSVPHTSSNRLLLSNQDKGCTPSVAHSLALPLGPALLNLWNIQCGLSVNKIFSAIFSVIFSWCDAPVQGTCLGNLKYRMRFDI